MQTFSAAKKFQSTHPVRGGTCTGTGTGSTKAISIHPPREGWDAGKAAPAPATVAISIHPPREGWDLCRFCPAWGRGISIHPPREGWDGGVHLAWLHLIKISIHPPREGWDSLCVNFCNKNL